MPPHPTTSHDCTQADVLDRIDGKLDQIIERLAKGDTALALLAHRIAFVEKIVYGLCSVVLLAVLGAVVALVVKGHP
jgi:hypothetical protein